MPWWVWLLCALFLVAVLVAGAAFVIVHALRALHVVGDVGGRLAEPISAMGEAQEPSDTAGDPLFVRPLRESIERYEQAHAAVIRRREDARDRHAETWRRWNED